MEPSHRVRKTDFTPDTASGFTVTDSLNTPVNRKATAPDSRGDTLMPCRNW